MSDTRTRVIIVKNFDIKTGYNMPYYAEHVVFVQEVNGSLNNTLKFNFDNKTKILNIFSNTHDIISNDVIVTYMYNNFELRKIKIKKLLHE